MSERLSGRNGRLSGMNGRLSGMNGEVVGNERRGCREWTEGCREWTEGCREWTEGCRERYRNVAKATAQRRRLPPKSLLALAAITRLWGSALQVRRARYELVITVCSQHPTQSCSRGNVQSCDQINVMNVPTFWISKLRNACDDDDDDDDDD